MERRDFLKGVVFTAGALAVRGVTPEIARAHEEDWQPEWFDQKTNWPEPVTGEPGERVRLPLSIPEGQTAVITCGPVFYQDKFGYTIDFKGGEDKASFILVKGPAGSEHGGEDLDIMVLPTYNWKGVTNNPEGQINLEQVHVETVIREREASLRNPNISNGGDFKGSTLDVGVIDGRIGSIEETRQVNPKRS